ncbi:hypothetical protein ACQPZ2_21010 [Nocardia pseudovaccinii]|uniref:hypothetical protein n=1 Tax=Nocardia pseudovaccinii TaxID=189540 RepID=UPI003D8D0670
MFLQHSRFRAYRNVVVEVQGVADFVDGVDRCAVEAIDGDDERRSASFQEVHDGKGIARTASIGDDDRAQRAT